MPATVQSSASPEFIATTTTVVDDHEIVDSSFTGMINPPVEKIDIPDWCSTLPEHEYRGCSPAHIAAGFTTSPKGKHMSINVEIIGASAIVTADEIISSIFAVQISGGEAQS